MTESKPLGMDTEPTIELTKADVIRLISPAGIFWQSCRCEGCRALRIKLDARFPGVLHRSATQAGQTDQEDFDARR